MNPLFAELRRRNVFRVAAAYLVVGWLVMQVVATIGSAAGLPDWTDSFALILLITGFPIVLFIAWAFELTPEGMKKTGASGEVVGFKPLGTSDFVLIAAVVAVFGVAGLQAMGGSANETTNEIAARAGTDTSLATSLEAAPVANASIAVLPFADMSAAGDQEYFADGISEEILNVLVRLPGLRVAGRTSSFAYKGRNEDLRVIGEALGVSHVLEGSVRRSGTRLRITAQLIRSEDGFHIWSDTYDREMTDIFDIQDEIAAAVSAELAVSLGLIVERADATRTDNIAAYEDYLRARALYLDRERTGEALALLTSVVARDPEFSPAWSTMAGVYLIHEYYQTHDSPELRALWRRSSLHAANRAIALNPRDAEAYATRGEGEAIAWDGIRAFESFDRALELAPSNAIVIDRVAQNLFNAGYFDQSEALALRAVELDPQVSIYKMSLGRAASGQGDNDRGVVHFAGVLRLNPVFRHAHMAIIDRRVKVGDLEGAQAAVAIMLATMPANTLPDEPWRDFIEARTHEDLLAVAANAADEFILHSVRRWALSLAGETESMIAQWSAALEATEPQMLRLFLAASFPGVRNDPRWKAQIRRTGIWALWQTRGFPSQCRPLEGDDFECDAWMGPE